ncbi:DUF6587 family protein [Luteimonas lutimaris]|uniref:Cellulose biosynthesis protein BcsF n=1 Tax=Luteimonas lutimaris TaxID=698645 RepID=A0ABP7ML78_9GAMM|nr:DUF6587 family protein [Luteimonas sp.]
MDTGLVIQYVVIALAVLASAGVVMKKQFPGATRRLRIAMALPLLREGRPAWLRGIGRVVAPAGMAQGGGASRSDACGGCSNCD